MRCTRSALETRPAALASGLDCSSALEGQRLSPCLVGTGAKRPYSGPWDKIVAQVSNLLCRRASSLHAVRTISRARRLGRSADWKSAIQQVGNLRYGELAALPY